MDILGARYNVADWLPTSKKEVEMRGWDELDVILFSGDAYVDHPSFGAAVIGRLLEDMGLQVAIVPQPNWQDDLRDFKKLGKPRLFFGITAGCMDSMVNHYTANKRKRSDDSYSPNGASGFRPDYPTVTYTQILKKLYPDVPVVIGGIEASLRRVTHYDYWQNKLLPNILEQSGADLLVYGMGEKPLANIIQLLEKGVPFNKLDTIPQTAIQRDKEEIPKHKKWENLMLNSHEWCLRDKEYYAENFKYVEEESNRYQSTKRLVQHVGQKALLINPPFPPMSEKEIDRSFDLPYTRLPHPRYRGKRIPAYDMIRFSINMHRGCFGGCSFCTISAHQGKFIASRSEKSILKEVTALTQHPEFKGNISDIGGPSANMYKLKGKDEKMCIACTRPSCIHPHVCSNLNTNHQPMLDLYKKVEEIDGIKKVFVGSGIRYDLLFSGPDMEIIEKDKVAYATKVIQNHVSGRLKVAPEHTSPDVLKVMRKPNYNLFGKFIKFFEKANNDAGLKQQIIPYFISSHPGCKPEDMADLAAKTKDHDFKLEQVQDFTPTPMTLATVIYYSGINPYTKKPVFTAISKDEKLAQRQFFFWYKKEFQAGIRKTLQKINRGDMVKKLLG